MMLYPDKQGLGNTAIGPNFQMSFLQSIGPMNTFLFQYRFLIHVKKCQHNTGTGAWNVCSNVPETYL